MGMVNVAYEGCLRSPRSVIGETDPMADIGSVISLLSGRYLTKTPPYPRTLDTS